MSRERPKGCDQQGRFPEAAEPCVDLDELGVRIPEPEGFPWEWLFWCVLFMLLLAAIFWPLGG